MTDTVSSFLRPTGVVVVGASREPTKLGYGLARNLVQSGYPGAVHFVNPKGGQLFGRTICQSIQQVPDPVDLAVLLAPAPQVPAALRECGERGIKAVIVASGGFREVGQEGFKLEQECVAIAEQYGLRFIGPNCIGLIDTHLPLDTTFLQPPGPQPGDVAFISHSGAICAAVIDWARGQGIGLSYLISLGNQANVNEADMLEPVAADPHTRVLTLYLEGISDGRRFVEKALRVTPKKPLLALKVGRFESGKKAAASHTGALAGAESAFDAAFDRAGVIRANTTEEMFQWARALAWCPLPHGRRVAILTNAGGPGVTAADALELNGLKLAGLSAETEEKMRQFLPSAASLHNPVDMLASASPEHYARCLQALQEDPGVDSVMIITPPPPMFATGAVTKACIPIIQMADKPVIFVLMGDRLIAEAVEHLRALQIPEYRFPEWAASALGVLSRRAESLARLGEAELKPARLDISVAKKLVAADPAAGGFLSQETVYSLLEMYGIQTTRVQLAATKAEACKLADAAGYPVVVKVASGDIPHKSDVGGVMLNLKDTAEVDNAFDTVIQRARAARPEAKIDGVHIQRMLPPGQEVIVGAVQDAQFGALMMFGSGGVEVEGLKDVAFALAPLTATETENMLEKTWAGRKLKGFRSLAPADRDAVKDALARLAQLAGDLPEILEIEVNPLRVLKPGEGAVAVDIRARVKQAE
jgi:acetyltransferase